MLLIGRCLMFLLLWVVQSNCMNKKCQTKPANELSIRLPGDLIPSHYLIRLQPFLNGNFTFNGYLEITFTCKKPTNKIILHIDDIITHNDTVRLFSWSTGSPIETPIAKQEFSLTQQFYIASLPKNLEEGGIYTLAMNYHGYLNDDMKGFYRSSYTDSEGNEIMLAATRFEATDARKAFPCFDEPAFKAKFTIEMIREEGLRTVSNMPRYDTIPWEGSSGWFVDRFNTSLPMSTYLVAFIVSDFAYLELNETSKSNYDYNFRVWARNESKSHLKYAMSLGPKNSKYFEMFFDVPFPLPKQDMVAVPDFAIGGMENWGLIKYRESTFLYDEQVTKAKDKMGIASVISHELAHMWFGDLVTPTWWSDLWLKEGFATYVGNLGLDHTEPEMRPLEQFIISNVHKAFRMDSLENSHPISMTVTDPTEIDQIFDTISYDKGASIIGMMSSFLSEKTFRKGLTNYLTDFSYSNAEQDDLWRYLTEQAHIDKTLPTNLTVKDIMDTWTLQMGFPVVTVTRCIDGSAELEQERFLLNGDATVNATHDYKWWIPITFTNEESPNFSISRPSDWFSSNSSSLNIPDLPHPSKWVIFNPAQTGFYRVNYDANNWKQIIRQLHSDNTVISNINKAQIIDDSMNLARSGRLSYEISLKIMSYISKESEFVPISAAMNNLEYLRSMFKNSQGYYPIKKYLTSLIIPIYNEIGFTDRISDPHLEQRKREIIMGWACELGYKPCVEAAVDLYDHWMKNPENRTIISPNLKATVFCTAIKEGGEEEWKFAWDRYTTSTLGTEKKELLEAMGCTRSIWILNAFLNRTLTAGKGIRKQMVQYIIPAVAKTEIGNYVAWQFLRSRWNNLGKYMGTGAFVLDRIIESITQHMNTELQYQDLIAFRTTYKGQLLSAKRAVNQAIENVGNNVKWMSNYYETIKDFVKQDMASKPFSQLMPTQA